MPNCSECPQWGRGETAPCRGQRISTPLEKSVHGLDSGGSRKFHLNQILPMRGSSFGDLTTDDCLAGGCWSQKTVHRGGAAWTKTRLCVRRRPCSELRAGALRPGRHTLLPQAHRPADLGRSGRRRGSGATRTGEELGDSAVRRSRYGIWLRASAVTRDADARAQNARCAAVRFPAGLRMACAPARAHSTPPPPTRPATAALRESGICPVSRLRGASVEPLSSIIKQSKTWVP
jgi:hypothetical protein